MSIKFLNRSLWQRIFGIPATDKPKAEKSWQYESGTLTIDTFLVEKQANKLLVDLA